MCFMLSYNFIFTEATLGRGREEKGVISKRERERCQVYI